MTLLFKRLEYCFCVDSHDCASHGHYGVYVGMTLLWLSSVVVGQSDKVNCICWFADKKCSMRYFFEEGGGEV